jgi:hypothetical protein
LRERTLPIALKATGHRPKGTGTMSDFERAGVEVIRVIDNSTYVPRAIPTYVALGFLEEYGGRNIVEDGETVETFFPGESESIRRRFVSVLHDVAREKDIVAQIHQEVGPYGHVAIISPELTTWLNSLYLPVFDAASNFIDSQGRSRRSTYANIRAEMFPEIRSREYRPDEVDCRFSFLLGCHVRYGKNNSFKLANAPHKVKLIIEFGDITTQSKGVRFRGQTGRDLLELSSSAFDPKQTSLSPITLSSRRR